MCIQITEIKYERKFFIDMMHFVTFYVSTSHNKLFMLLKSLEFNVFNAQCFDSMFYGNVVSNWDIFNLKNFLLHKTRAVLMQQFKNTQRNLLSYFGNFFTLLIEWKSVKWFQIIFISSEIEDFLIIFCMCRPRMK